MLGLPPRDAFEMVDLFELMNHGFPDLGQFPFLNQQPHHLSDEQGVALGLPVHRLYHPRRWSYARGQFDEPTHVCLVQASE